MHFQSNNHIIAKILSGSLGDIPVSFVEIAAAWEAAQSGSERLTRAQIHQLMWGHIYVGTFRGSVVQFWYEFVPGVALRALKEVEFGQDALRAHLLEEIQKGADGYKAALGIEYKVEMSELQITDAEWFWSGYSEADHEKRLGIRLSAFAKCWSITGEPMPPFFDHVSANEKTSDHTQLSTSLSLMTQKDLPRIGGRFDDTIPVHRIMAYKRANPRVPMFTIAKKIALYAPGDGTVDSIARRLNINCKEHFADEIAAIEAGQELQLKTST